MTVKGKDMLAAFGGIEEDILLRSETEKGEREKGKTFRGKTFWALAACLILAVGAFALLAGGALANRSPLKTPPVSDPAPYTSENKAESAGAADTTTVPDVYGGPGIDPAAAATSQEDGDGSVNTPFQTVQPGDSYSGGPETSAGVTGTQYWCVPCIPPAPGAVEVGEKITDEEAQVWLAENTWIRSALTASGVPADSAVYSEKGYCHVKYDGNVDKKQAEVRLDFRDYLLWDGDKLIAIVTLTKENGQIDGTPAFGGPGFDAFGAFLREHKGEELLFVYAKFMEIVILPDGTCVNPMGVDLTPYRINEVLDDPYAYFYNENAIFIP